MSSHGVEEVWVSPHGMGQLPQDDSNVDIHVKVIDWGLGFYFKRGRMKTCVGTSAYAAPEVQQPVPWREFGDGNMAGWKIPLNGGLVR